MARKRRRPVPSPEPTYISAPMFSEGVKLILEIIGVLIALVTVTCVPALTAYVTITRSSTRLETRMDAMEAQNKQIMDQINSSHQQVSELAVSQADIGAKLANLKEQQATIREKVDGVKERVDRTVNYLLESDDPMGTRRDREREKEKKR